MYDDGGDDGGCLGAIIMMALLAVFFEILKWVGVAALVIGAIALIIFIGKALSAHFEKAEAERKVKEEQKKKEEESKRIEEENARIALERKSYNEYLAAYYNSEAQDKLNEATDIINKLITDEDEENKSKILEFFNKYLPLMTETLDVSSRTGVDIDETIERFTETIRKFSNNLYKVEDIIESNQTTLESLAAMDGLIDPYGIDIKAETEKIEKQRSKDAATEKESIEETV